jgi:hypothetical protein
MQKRQGNMSLSLDSADILKRGVEAEIYLNDDFCLCNLATNAEIEASIMLL